MLRFCDFKCRAQESSCPGARSINSALGRDNNKEKNRSYVVSLPTVTQTSWPRPLTTTLKVRGVTKRICWGFSSGRSGLGFGQTRELYATRLLGQSLGCPQGQRLVVTSHALAVRESPLWSLPKVRVLVWMEPADGQTPPLCRLSVILGQACGGQDRPLLPAPRTGETGGSTLKVVPPSLLQSKCSDKLEALCHHKKKKKGM